MRRRGRDDMAAVHDDIAGGAELTAQEKRGHRILIFRRIVAYVVLILVCVIALFPFVTLLINLTKDHATLTSTFNLLPGDNFLVNLKNALNDPNKPVIQAMGNSFIVAAITCIASVYIAALTAYGLYAYDFRLKKSCICRYYVCPYGTDSGICSWICRPCKIRRNVQSSSAIDFPYDRRTGCILLHKAVYGEFPSDGNRRSPDELMVDMSFTYSTLWQCRF